MSAADGPGARAARGLLFLAKAAVSGGLIWLALSQADLGAVGDSLAALSAGTLALALGILFAMSALAALRWSVLSGAIGLPLGFARACRFLFVGLFFNQTLPSSLGGDAFRVLLLRGDSRNEQRPGWSEALANVLLDRAVGVSALAAVSLLGLPVLLALGVPWAAPAVVAGLGAAAIAALAGLWWLSGRPPFRREGRMLALLRRLADGLRALAARRSTGLAILVLSLAVHLLLVLAAFVLLAGMGRPVAFGLLLAIVPAVMLIAILPVSIAGWGVREGAMVVGLGLVGVPEAGALAVSLLIGAGLFVTGLPGAALWLTRPRPAPAPDADLAAAGRG